MRALRITEPNSEPRLVRDAPEPTLQPGDALVRPTLTALSSTDVLAQQPVEAPITIGHQFVGIVDRVEPGGASASGIEQGARVVGSLATYCGECDLCKGGLRDHCRNRTVVGVHGRDGCHAEALALPTTALHLVPDELDDERAVFAQPVADALHAAQQLRLDAKAFITVLGSGVRALLTVQAMTRLNATVRLIASSEHARALCDKWGIKHRGPEDIGHHADQDVVVETTNTAFGFDIATRLLRPRGTILLATAHLGPSEHADLARVAEHELHVIGSHAGRTEAGVRALLHGEIDVTGLVTRRMKLDDAEEARAMARQPDQFTVLLAP